MKKLSFTKEHTQIAKGVAILLMLTHHLFAFPDRIYVSSGYISMLQIKGLDIEYFLGSFGKLCVAMYLFLSGYGIYMVTQKRGKFKLKDSLKRVKNIYINYWAVFIVFIPIGFIFFNKNFSNKEFIENFLGLSSSYNWEWWFFRLYIELILLVPLLKIIVKDKLTKSLINVISLVILAELINKIFYNIPNTEHITNTLIYNDFINLLNWQSAFFMGYICAKFNIYSRVISYFIKLKIDNKLVYILLCILLVGIRYIKVSILTDAILASVFIFATVNILYNSIFHKFFIKLGNHSTNMWLTHSFFCYMYFQELVFAPRISIFILAFLVILSIISSILINYLIKNCKMLSIKLKDKYKLSF